MRRIRDKLSPETELTLSRHHRYLRKALFPMHPSLRLAGLLPPLDCPHHVRRDDESPFREGVVVQAAGSGKGKHAGNGGALVDVGLWDPIEASNGENVPEGTRVTVRMPLDQHSYGGSRFLLSCRVY